MDEDINVINNNTRNEKIKEFLISNKKKNYIFSIFYFYYLNIFFWIL